MASQTLTAPFQNRDTVSLKWPPTGFPFLLLDAALVVGDPTTYLGRITLNGDSGLVSFGTTGDLGGETFPAGPDMSDAWESNPSAIKIEVASESLSVTFGNAGASDPNEPYTWTPSNSAEVIAFIAAYRALPSSSLQEPRASTTITLSDESGFNLYVGSSKVSKVYVGSSQVTRIYVGSTEI